MQSMVYIAAMVFAFEPVRTEVTLPVLLVLRFGWLVVLTWLFGCHQCDLATVYETCDASA